MVCYFRFSKSFPQFVMIHAVKGFGIVNETEVQVFLEYLSFLSDPANVGNLISGVRKRLTRVFLCAVLDLSGTLWLLLIPEYSGIKRRGTPFPGLRNTGISHYSNKYPLPFYEPDSKR